MDICCGSCLHLCLDIVKSCTLKTCSTIFDLCLIFPVHKLLVRISYIENANESWFGRIAMRNCTTHLHFGPYSIYSVHVWYDATEKTTFFLILVTLKFEFIEQLFLTATYLVLFVSRWSQENKIVNSMPYVYEKYRSQTHPIFGHLCESTRASSTVRACPPICVSVFIFILADSLVDARTNSTDTAKTYKEHKLRSI